MNDDNMSKEDTTTKTSKATAKQAIVKERAAAGKEQNVAMTKTELESLIFFCYALNITAPNDIVNFGKITPRAYKQARIIAKDMRIAYSTPDKA